MVEYRSLRKSRAPDAHLQRNDPQRDTTHGTRQSGIQQHWPMGLECVAYRYSRALERDSLCPPAACRGPKPGIALDAYPENRGEALCKEGPFE